MLLSMFIFMYFLKSFSLANVKIESSLLFCKFSSEVINFETSCLDESEFLLKLNCISCLNNLKSGRDKFENEFKYIYTFNSKKVYYFSKNRVFNTECSKISSFEIIENFETCNRDIKIGFNFVGASTTGFLTKEGIIISESQNIDCKEVVYFPLNDHFDIFRKDNKVQIFENKQDLKEEKLKTEFNYSDSGFANFVLYLSEKYQI